MEWTDEVIGRLRTLWAEGLTTAEIGRRLGISKNAVVGKAHRLALASRPSPIRRGVSEKRRAAPKRTTGPTLPPLSAPALEGPPPPPPIVGAAPTLRSVGRSSFASGGRVLPCCWPIGEPGTRSFRFCDAESLGGKPYCATHAQLAYVKVRDRRDDAA